MIPFSIIFHPSKDLNFQSSVSIAFTGTQFSWSFPKHQRIINTNPTPLYIFENYHPYFIKLVPFNHEQFGSFDSPLYFQYPKSLFINSVHH